jgi:hypothetical protein
MLNNYLLNNQKELFLDIYKTVINAELSANKDIDSMVLNQMISDAATIAMKSVELLIDDYDCFKPMKDVVNIIQNTRPDKLFEFPEIVDNK